MQFTLSRTLTTLAVAVFVIVMLGTAGSFGFFGDMFGDMFGMAADTTQSGTTGTTGSGSRPLPTATVRR